MCLYQVNESINQVSFQTFLFSLAKQFYSLELTLGQVIILYFFEDLPSHTGFISSINLAYS